MSMTMSPGVPTGEPRIVRVIVCAWRVDMLICSWVTCVPVAALGRVSAIFAAVLLISERMAASLLLKDQLADTRFEVG